MHLTFFSYHLHAALQYGKPRTVEHVFWYNERMNRTTQTTYRYRLNPTAAQEKILIQFAGARRFVWNWALNRKHKTYRETGTSLSYHDLAAELTRNHIAGDFRLRRVARAHARFRADATA